MSTQNVHKFPHKQSNDCKNSYTVTILSIKTKLLHFVNCLHDIWLSVSEPEVQLKCTNYVQDLNPQNCDNTFIKMVHIGYYYHYDPL